MSDTEELFDYLKYGGFRFRVINSRLVVTPDSGLTPALRLAIERHNDGLVWLVDEDFRPPTSRSIKRREVSRRRPGNQLQLLLFVKRDPCAN